MTVHLPVPRKPKHSQPVNQFLNMSQKSWFMRKMKHSFSVHTAVCWLSWNLLLPEDCCIESKSVSWTGLSSGGCQKTAASSPNRSLGLVCHQEVLANLQSNRRGTMSATHDVHKPQIRKCFKIHTPQIVV